MRVRVRVPATSANLGPGFDALGLALALYNEVILEEADGISVSVEGEGAGRLDDGAQERGRARRRPGLRGGGPARSAACASAASTASRSAGASGSSAAAWVGGLVAANALLGEPLDRDALLTRRPAPRAIRTTWPPRCWAGSPCPARRRARRRGEPAGAARDRLGGAAARDGELHAGGPRGAARTRCSRADAVFNVQRVSLLLAALGAGRPDLLDLAMQDRLHQPYRPRLFPWMEAVAGRGAAARARSAVS